MTESCSFTSGCLSTSVLSKEYIDSDLAVPCYNFDYERVITKHGNFTEEQENNSTSSSFDSSVVLRKLQLWDKIINNSYLTDNGLDDRGKVQDKYKYYRYLKSLTCLKDRTIFAYSQFKFDNKPLILRDYQDALLSDRSKRILFCASNQIGKSITLDTDAATEFCTDHEKNWVGILVSKSLDQSEFQMSRIKDLLKSADITYREESTTDKKTGQKDNTVKISYTFYDPLTKKPKYTNLLVCCPPTGSALGYPCDGIWLDEFDFWKDIDQNWFIKQIAIPRTFDTKGFIKIFTNPDGKKELNNLWTEVKTKGKDKGKPVWHRYQFNFWDKPGATQEEFDDSSEGMTRHQIHSTLLAVFSDSQGCLFSEKEILQSEDSNLTEFSLLNKQLFCFLDIGSTHDQCAFHMGYIEPDKDNPNLRHLFIPLIIDYPVGYPLARVVGSNIDYNDGWHYEMSVKEYLIKYSRDGSMPIFGLDCTGNSGIVPLFNAAGIYNIVDITFSGPVKSGMYQRFKYFMEKGLLHRVPNKAWSNQAKTLMMKKGTRGYWLVHHEKEDDLDDHMDTTAGLIFLADNPVEIEPSMEVFNTDTSLDYTEYVDQDDLGLLG